MTIARPVRLAVVLWIVWAIVVWNVIFDRILVLAGRRYVYAAWMAAEGTGPYLRASDWMRSAVTRGVWTATAVAGALLLVGFVLIAIASRRVVASPRSNDAGHGTGMERASAPAAQADDAARDRVDHVFRLGRG